MHSFPPKEVVKKIRKQFPKGTRVELIRMDDPYTKLKPGDQGSVNSVDDTGTIFCDWDKGSSLGIVYKVDALKKI